MGTWLVLTLVVQSAAFADGKPIPREHTCDGADRSPPLTVDQIPAGTQSWAILVDDPDAPGGTFVHWVLYNSPALLRSWPAGLPRDQLVLTDRSNQGQNGFGNVGYNGPCPPRGKPHHYRFHVLALDGRLQLPARASAGDVERAARGHLVGEGTLTGTYVR